MVNNEFHFGDWSRKSLCFSCHGNQQDVLWRSSRVSRRWMTLSPWGLWTAWWAVEQCIPNTTETIRCFILQPDRKSWVSILDPHLPPFLLQHCQNLSAQTEVRSSLMLVKIMRSICSLRCILERTKRKLRDFLCYYTSHFSCNNRSSSSKTIFS